MVLKSAHSNIYPSMPHIWESVIVERDGLDVLYNATLICVGTH